VTPFVFFTSYARLDANKVSKLDKVIDELLVRVRGKLGLMVDPKEVGFFDRTNIETGKKWEEVLGNDLRSARVIVCLCSPTYFNSAYCAKEFEVFRRRLAGADKKVQGRPIVVPVIWEPGAQRVESWMPQAVAQFQPTDDRLPAAYGELGLTKLKQIKGQRDNLTLTLDVLAEIIKEGYEASLPEWPEPVSFDDLPGSFPNPKPGPYNVCVAVLNQAGMSWSVEPTWTIRRITELATSSLKVGWQEIVTGPDLVQKAAAAHAERQVTIVLADSAGLAPPWNVYLEAMDSYAETLARKETASCAVLVGLDPPAGGILSSADADASLQKLLPRSYPLISSHDWFPRTDRAALEAKVSQAITRLRTALVNADPPRKVEDPGLQADAASAGIPVDTRPVVTGPGAGSP
jgi:TIR domain